MRETIVRETEQLSEKLPYLADFAEQIREHDLGLTSDYKQFYSVKMFERSLSVKATGRIMKQRTHSKNPRDL